MGVLEEAKERLAGIQCKIQRVYDAGEAVGKVPNNKMAHTKFKIMYATLENLCSDFEAQLTVIIRSQCKGGVVGELVDTEKLRTEFEDKYVGSKIFADEYLPEATAEASLNKTFMEQKPTATTSAYFPVEKLSIPIFNGNPIEYTSFERHTIIKELNRCFRCFSAHRVVDCKNPKTCKDCGGKHHTMLHLSNTEKTVIAEPVTFAATATNSVRTSVLLATAIVVVQTTHGYSVNVRALLDSASQSSFVTERCVHLLGLQRENRDIVVQALAGTQVPVVKGSTTINVRPVGLENPQFNVNALILPRITGPIPSERVFTEPWPHTVGLNLADPDYEKPLPVDILLGADVFPQLILGDKRVGNTGQPTALSTVFGWVLMGRTLCATKNKIVTMCSTLESVNQTLKRFFEVEEVPNVEKSCPADLECERIYQSTTTRQPDGRYVVHLPFLKTPPQLGQSKDQALNRLYHLENRFAKNRVLREEYNKEMRDYLDTTHMTKLNQTLTNEHNTYYIPHHVVIRPESTTTKMRIVFDASAKTSSGMSLNDNLYCGKKLQQDLPGIILRFRLHPIVFTADIKKMFRQIVVTEKHRPYQRLLYRFNPEEPVQEYEMNRVTFGQKFSPFIAIRTLHKLVDDEASNDETLKAIVHRDLYVDDIVTGTSTLNEALELTQNLITLFKKGKFELRKWSSNSEQLLTHIPLEHRQVLPITFEERDSGCTKVLGLKWDPKVDSLSYQYQPCPVKFSKRVILSEIARIYDPLGLLTPVTMDLKRLMKYLWLVGVNWDETIPEEAMTSWTQYHRELPVLATLQIPRMVTHPNATYELHGFSDASEVAYAAAVYLRIDTGTEVRCHLLMGKSKIAPAKKISVPRLELCGAWLLARLLAFAKDNLSAINIEKVTAWSDSMVTLHWIKSSTSRLKTFVANRVSKIQEQTHVEYWRHVPTNDNPTDCASRGLRPDLLANHDIWWCGPPFLRQPEREWPVESTLSPISCSEEENEEKPITLLSQGKEEDCRLLYQSDNLPKVLRLTVYWLRFRDRLRKKPFLPSTSPPTTDETDRALRSLVRWTQDVYFSDEKKDLSMGKPARRHLRKLTPFLDDDHLLRKEYILSLHERSKWTRPNRNLQVGDLVLVNEPSAPLTWPTARVVEVHPGADGIVQMAKVKLSTGKIYTRPSVKLCPLPLSD
ncbi:unnamed protein product [Macrosiphum euphorbiae]|uniref:Uncharacterized protein n=1 Tax=Macrosiphum euphorbiae TaxID=13131 RepID=A0AAV0VGW4_9HEMI|nr:unnamed protein product [Macrosiphum euphorbiae]